MFNSWFPSFFVYNVDLPLEYPTESARPKPFPGSASGSKVSPVRNPLSPTTSALSGGVFGKVLFYPRVLSLRRQAPVLQLSLIVFELRQEVL